MTFVRTEQRPGSEAPEHFFIEARDRTVFQRWIPDGDLPEELELVLDPDADARARRVENEMSWIKLERDALVEAMKLAVTVVPDLVAGELRRIYRERSGAGAPLTRSS